jgi:nucleotide-binding universal stress UspA family protein
VICALDHSALSARVLRHAAGVAGACGAQLTILTVSPADSRREQARVEALIAGTLPAGASYLQAVHIRVARVTQGHPSDAILQLASEGYDLVVAGTQSRGGLARWFLGSTSSELLERAICPTLLVPPGDTDVVTLTPDEARLNVGTVMAAVDLAEHNVAQVALASRLAELAHQPLVLCTVVNSGDTAAEAEKALLERAQALPAEAVRQVIVRAGSVAQEIGRAAAAQGAGLVVMGLRERGLGQPGATATAVLKEHHMLVLAVPAS